MTYNILALDGGSRPLMMTGILEELENRSPGFLGSVDLFAGTSAGALVAAFIAAAPTPRHGLQRAKEFLMSPVNFRIGMLRPLTAIGGAHSFSDQSSFVAGLERQFGGTTLADLERPILFTSISLDNQSQVAESRRWSMRLFHTLGPMFPDTELRVVDAVVRSSSAPIMSPVYQGHADGGLFANNPSLCALTAAHDYVGVSFDGMRVVSVGHGQGQGQNIDCSRRTDFGYHKWLLDPANPMALLRLVMDSNLQAVTYQCSRLLEDRFVRIDPHLPRDAAGNGLSFSRQALGLRRAAGAVDYRPIIRQLETVCWSKTESAAATA